MRNYNSVRDTEKEKVGCRSTDEQGDSDDKTMNVSRGIGKRRDENGIRLEGYGCRQSGGMALVTCGKMG